MHLFITLSIRSYGVSSSVFKVLVERSLETWELLHFAESSHQVDRRRRHRHHPYSQESRHSHKNPLTEWEKVKNSRSKEPMKRAKQSSDRSSKTTLTILFFRGAFVVSSRREHRLLHIVKIKDIHVAALLQPPDFQDDSGEILKQQRNNIIDTSTEECNYEWVVLGCDRVDRLMLFRHNEEKKRSALSENYGISSREFSTHWRFHGNVF